MPRYSISQPVTQTEAPRLLTGRGQYTDDVPLRGAAHAVFLRSPFAHAKITKLEVGAAKQMPGVLDVLTGADYVADGIGNVPGSAPPKRSDGSAGFRPPRTGLATDKVTHVGQMIACVIAETINDAKDAVEAIEIDFDPLPVNTDPLAGVAEGAFPIYEGCDDNEAFSNRKGDEEATARALESAPHVVKGSFTVSRVTANSMEPRAVAADYDPGRDHFTIYACQQRPFTWRTMMCQRVFNIPENQMTMIAGDVGGSFGMKGGLYPEVPVVAWASKRLRRPVKWTCERSEAHISDDQARDLVVDAELGFDDDGRILAVRYDAHANVGAYLSMNGFGTPNGIAGYTVGTYDIPTVYGKSRAVLTNTQPMANYRGPSGTPGSYVLERLVDMAAEQLDMDPTEIRRRNFIPADAMPVKLPNGDGYDCGEFEAVMDKCLTLADYANIAKRREEAKARGKLYGVGVSAAVDPSGSPAPEMAELRFDPSGTVTVLTASTAGGQSHQTIYTQIVSDVLGIDSEQIQCVEGDTSKHSWGSGTGAARTATICGSVVLLAAEKTREKCRKIAAHMLEAAEEDIDFDDGTFTVAGTDRSVSFTDVAKNAFKPERLPDGMEFGLNESASWTPETTNIPNDFHVCEVEIDPDTGKAQMVRYAAVHDVGVELNPALVDGQAVGAIAQAAGQALMEQIIYDPETGQNLTGSFLDYCMPRADDFCEFQIGRHPVPTQQNPLGVKGAGEGGTVAGIAAVMNAVHDALRPVGVKNLMMPATPEKIWKAIRDAKAA
jgi:carbon-monoxide dehydrogenase large subunit